MKISQPEHGGNGESAVMVNGERHHGKSGLAVAARRFAGYVRPEVACKTAARVPLRPPLPGKTVAPNHQSDPIFDPDKESF
jgi:hypothetical protein